MKEIPLRNCAEVALVDDSDFELLSKFKWYKCGRGYAFRQISNGKSKLSFMMHRELLGAPRSLDVDHRDRNRLNNQRHNLRTATRGQNCANAKVKKTSKTGVKGVHYVKSRNAYCAVICRNYQSHYLGYFKNIQDAAAAYTKAAKEMFGEFARST